MILHGQTEQRDALTGTLTAAAMQSFIEAALDLSEPQGPGVVVFAVGIDRFGDLEARHGRAVADAVLLGMADRLRAGLRGGDVVGRLPQGFSICLPEVFSSQARPTAERLRRGMEAEPMPSPAGPVAIGCSVGLAFGRGPGTSAADLVARAAAALAAAQRAGGSRTMVDAA